MSLCTYQWRVRLLMHFMHMTTLITSSLCYHRPPPRKMIDISIPQTLPLSSAQQVHISMAGEDKVRISWMTQSITQSVVFYGTSKENYNFTAKGTSTSYSYLLYKSGLFHHVVIGPLKPNTTYFYKCGTIYDREFTFRTPPTTFPLKFAVAGDLGQTMWTKSTLEHISKSEYDVFLLPGDLSYADRKQRLWDSFGQLVEPLASQRPWMVAVGNHEPEKIFLLHSEPFTAYNARWQMPFKESNSPSNLYYSFNVVGVHVIVLASYTDFYRGSPQYNWFEADLRSVDRVKTPWIIVIIHAPWYNSNKAHQSESASIDMKIAMEGIVRKARVDIVFAGHVHAYERFSRVYNNRGDECGPVHITIGDGGNREGLALKYVDPKPILSAFREASFGHGQLTFVNNTHARWEWHRNEDDQATVADSVWLQNLSDKPACKN